MSVTNMLLIAMFPSLIVLHVRYITFINEFRNARDYVLRDLDALKRGNNNG